MARKKSDINRPFHPAYVSKTTLGFLLDLSAPTIDRLIAKQIIPQPTNIDGIDRWRWDDVDSALASSGLNGLNVDDEISMGIQRVKEAQNGRTA